MILVGTKAKVEIQQRTHFCLARVKDEVLVLSRKLKIHRSLTRGIRKNNRREDIAKIQLSSRKRRIQTRFNF